jgi:hypothetical protein
LDCFIVNTGEVIEFVRYILVAVLLLSSYHKLSAQDDTLRQVIKTVFYERKVYDKIFIDYRLAEPYMKDFDLLPEGKYAFIYPESIFQEKFPSIMNKLYGSFYSEGKLLTVTYVKEKDATVFITDHKADSNIELLIMFEKIFFSSKKAELVFTRQVGVRKDL